MRKWGFLVRDVKSDEMGTTALVTASSAGWRSLILTLQHDITQKHIKQLLAVMLMFYLVRKECYL